MDPAGFLITAYQMAMMVTSTITHRITGGSEDAGYNDRDRCGKERFPTARGRQQGTGGVAQAPGTGKAAGVVANLPRCMIGIEACASAHHWAREIEKLGHEVKLINTKFVKAYVKSNKSDPNDAGH